MPDESKFTYKFAFKHTEAWGWHIGIHFCIEPKAMDGKRDAYLFICLGKHDFTIGMIHVYNEEEDSYV